MSSAAVTARNNPSEDELDDILDEIIGTGDLNASVLQNQTESNARSKPETSKDGLGIEEEIKIVKKRQPIPKLDETRLLSDAGVPRLRRISKDKLRFKGKGHEYGDIARMLNMYQLWLDDLYPRAKFADGLAMIEKLGHTKRIQVMRKEWIDESKPRRRAHTDTEEEDTIAAPVQSIEEQTEQMEGLEIASGGEQSQGQVHQEKGGGTTSILEGAEEPNEDELDALLAESTAPTLNIAAPMSKPPGPPEDDMYEDDMAAMAELDGW